MFGSPAFVDGNLLLVRIHSRWQRLLTESSPWNPPGRRAWPSRTCLSACSNPITLLCGEVCCSPYRDKQQTDSRTTVCAMGYPYNYEPLNFVRGAMSLICSSFAVFEILSYRRTFHEQDNILESVQLGFQFGGEDDENVGLAMQYWVYSCFGITALYLLMMIVRWYDCCCVSTYVPALIICCHSGRLTWECCWDDVQVRVQKTQK